jgi:sarcosine oxidase subunit beta
LDVGIILESLKAYLKDQGVNIRIKSEVVGFNFNGEAVTDVRLKNEEQLPFDIVVNCGGIWSSRIGKMLGTELPVAPEKRYLWSAEFRESADDFSSEDYRRIPFTVCTANGVSPYLKPEPATKGKHSFLLGCEHKVEPSWNFKPEDQDHVDSDFMPNLPEGFHTQVWEEVCKWLPFAENLGFRERVNGGFYETTPSHSPVIGFDPNHQNVIHCCGFSGHGVMHGPAAGATVADLIKFGEYRLVLSGDRNLSYASLMDGTREQESMKI